jgi:hypothetical protein
VHVGTVAAYTERVATAHEADARALLAPEPDFRYVGLTPNDDIGAKVAASLFLAGGSVGAGLLRELGLVHAALGAFLAATGLALVWRRVAPMRRVGSIRAPFAIVPWGVLVDHAEEPRVLRWAAVRALHVHTIYGRDAAATTSTLWSLVTLQTEHELFAGRTAGAAPLERLLAHMEAYAREQDAGVALDLDGIEPNTAAPLEPEFERILAAALELLLTAPSSHRLSLETSYRTTGRRAASAETLESLRGILRDRRAHELDRRPLAAVVAAELGLSELVPDLVALVQSPHPMVAATAKAAALRLGAPGTRVGVIDELAPFLPPEDVETLGAWIASAPLAARTHRSADVPSA